MLTIGKLSEATGVKVPTIRYYEQIQLLPPPERSAGNQRLYSKAARERLSFIRHAREHGFPLEAIRDLLRLSDQPDTPCHHADSIARRQLADTRRRIAQLRALEAELERMVTNHSHGKIADCRVIQVLGDHALCAHDHDLPPEGEAGD